MFAFARTSFRPLGVLAAAGALAVGLATPPASAQPRHGVDHVLLLSVDGMHQSDLAWYAASHPASALAALLHRSVSYTRASTPLPSDSFPGIIGQVTGGNPSSTGVYYDDSYNHGLLPAGTTDCAHTAPGAEVGFTEAADKDLSRLDAGQGLAGLPGSILSMTGSPQTLLNPAALPVDPVTCKPVYPHSYLQVNTIFEVARAHGLRTAWSDKHPAYDILNGPSGAGIQDLFTPEINSAAPAGGDWTKDNNATRQYDGYKVQAVLNEIDGYDHSRTTRSGTPAIFGMNFQSVSTAEKLPVSGGQPGGYLPGGKVPGPVLSGALDFVDAQLGRFFDEVKAAGLTGKTAIILSAKHGQSPVEPEALTRIDDASIIDPLNAAWAAEHPGAAPLVVFSTDDDALQLWLSDRSKAAAKFAEKFLRSHTATGNTLAGGSRTLDSSGLLKVYAGPQTARLFGTDVADARHPDVFGFVQHGVVFTSGKKKIAEHGGNDPQDRNVPLVVSVPGAVADTESHRVETTQIAPTILRLLGLDPRALDAVRIEGTDVLG